MIEKLFGSSKAIIGMVHLLPLPGSPQWRGDLQAVLRHARGDAEALTSGRVHGVIVENFGDVPFRKGRVEPWTVAAMTLAVKEVQAVSDVPIGINVLRNDAASALAIAYATGAQFIRVNVLTGAVVADEGIIEGRAHETLGLRSALGTDIKIFADVFVKHAVPLGPDDLRLAAKATVERGLADAVVVSGPATGEPASLEDIATVKGIVPETPVLVGSGVDETNVQVPLAIADGAIIGTSLKESGRVTNPVDADSVARLVKRMQAL